MDGLKITIIVLLILLIVTIISCTTAFLVFKGTQGFLTGIVSEDASVVYETVADDSFDMESVNKIDVSQAAGDIIFKVSEESKIEVKAVGNDKFVTSVDLNDGILKIVSKEKNKLNFLSLGSDKNEITIAIPANYNKDIKVKCNYGNVKGLSLENASIDFDVDAGNVEVGVIKNAIVDCDYGNVSIDEITNKCNINVDSGNAKIGKANLKENSEIKVDLGNIEISEVGDVCVDSSVELGKNTVNGGNKDSNVKLSLKCDFGNVSVGK